ncbi:MAG: cobyrinic acid a,c-diamide synthase, partial [Desulfobacteraceae bacterium]|nr:cobyrinic acid a,c-diamide synthase [Desulfobacteraceae bacterium]
ATRTVAALIMGCVAFDPELNIMGIILNRVAGKRHEGKVRKNIEKFCNIPVLGAIPKLRGDQFPERHMGLVTFEEHEGSKECIDLFSKVALENIDLDAIYNICRQSTSKPSVSIPLPVAKVIKTKVDTTKNGPIIGVIKDSAFQFYYPDNIEALIERGAKIKYISPLNQQSIPEDLDAIYMGGGFPETHAAKLAANTGFKSVLKKLAEKGLPIYAECG